MLQPVDLLLEPLHLLNFPHESLLFRLQLPKACTELLDLVSHVANALLLPEEAVLAILLVVLETINRLLVARMFLLGAPFDLDFLIVKFPPVAVQLLLKVSKCVLSPLLVLLEFLFKVTSRAVFSVP